MKQHDLAAFFQTVADIEKNYEHLAKQEGVGYVEPAVFHMLWHYAPCLQKNIAHIWQLPKQTVNNHCKTLLEKGLITAVQGDDKREKLLVLSEQGKAFCRPLMEKLAHIEQQALAIVE
ncbi:MarR family winged helix-turn-helix transcriptional regulator [Neisseria animalis]|uniref:HTH marR-type domain-containing protein n=1 Tax=Neisseria animalis TaxID=492 RepID=A0A5P3MR80_NEIAN|nr:hypothetical protein [Neisseria animalis]QEY24107.1 hypothetical protein D0T90_06060 [Neisseria animalis]ROW32675.1 hypothetical protein CGZ60_04400 [Neisseria animalis]VEE06302.1 transcriptional regulator [Neisseria animalis]